MSELCHPTDAELRALRLGDRPSHLESLIPLANYRDISRTPQAARVRVANREREPAAPRRAHRHRWRRTARVCGGRHGRPRAHRGRHHGRPHDPLPRHGRADRREGGRARRCSPTRRRRRARAVRAAVQVHTAANVDARRSQEARNVGVDGVSHACGRRPHGDAGRCAPIAAGAPLKGRVVLLFQPARGATRSPTRWAAPSAWCGYGPPAASSPIASASSAAASSAAAADGGGAEASQRDGRRDTSMDGALLCGVTRCGAHWEYARRHDVAARGPVTANSDDLQFIVRGTEATRRRRRGRPDAAGPPRSSWWRCRRSARSSPTESAVITLGKEGGFAPTSSPPRCVSSAPCGRTARR